ncbi:MAG: hypothetical protein Q9225_004285 [Loekoesia sp. 1 TL-2023]
MADRPQPPALVRSHCQKEVLPPVHSLSPRLAAEIFLPLRQPCPSASTMLPEALSSPFRQPLDHDALLFDHTVQYLKYDDSVSLAIGAFFSRLLLPPKGDDISSPSLRQETSNLSDYTVDSTSTFVNTPTTAPTPGSPVHHRTGYRRLASFSDQDTAYHGSEISPPSHKKLQEHGLGIKNLKPLPSAASPGHSNPDTPASASPLLSPPLLQSRRKYKPLQSPVTEGPGDWEEYTPRSEPYQPFVADSETENLRQQTTAPTIQSIEPSGTNRISFVYRISHVRSTIVMEQSARTTTKSQLLHYHTFCTTQHVE